MPLLWGIALGEPAARRADRRRRRLHRQRSRPVQRLLRARRASRSSPLFAFHGATFLTLRTTGDALRARGRAPPARLAIPAVVAGRPSLAWTVYVAVDATTATSSRRSCRRRSASLALVAAALRALAAQRLGLRRHRGRRRALGRDALHRASTRGSWSPAPTSPNSLTVDGAASSHYTLAGHDRRRARSSPGRPALPGAGRTTSSARASAATTRRRRRGRRAARPRRRRLRPMRALDPRLVRRARPVRTLLGVDAALGVGMALLVLLQATLMAHVIAEAFDGAALADVTTPLVAPRARLRGARRAGVGLRGRGPPRRLERPLRAPASRSCERRLRAQPAALDGVRGRRGRGRRGAGRRRRSRRTSRATCRRSSWPCAVPVAVLVQVALRSTRRRRCSCSLTLPLVPVFMWLVGQLHRGADAGALARAAGCSRRTSSTSSAACRRCARSTAARRRRTSIAEVGDRYRRATMATLRVGFLSGAVLELAATLGVALVAVTVGVRLADGGVGLRAGLTVLLLAPELYLPLRRLGAAVPRQRRRRRGRRARARPARRAGRGRRRRRPATPPSPARGDRAPRAASRSPTRRGPAPVLDGFDLSSRPARRSRSSARAARARARWPRCCCGLAEPTAGRVTVGGVDLADCRTDAWRAQLAWVPQRPTLLRGTVADNIRLADPRRPDERVRDAAAAAPARTPSSAALPDGYDDGRGRRRRPLSAGRAPADRAGARAAADAPLVLLDEPTADLDPASAALVADADRRAAARADRAADRPRRRARAARRPRRRAGARGRVAAPARGRA